MSAETPPQLRPRDVTGEPVIEAAGLGHWFFRGAANAASIPVLVLISAFIGFGGLAREAGLGLDHALFMTAFVWALPAQVVLIGAIQSGTGLLATAFAVTLSSVRLMPMVVALIPEIRSAASRRPVLYLLSHFVAVTSWVMALERVRHVPRAARTAWYAGLGLSLLVINCVVVTLVYLVAPVLPAAVSAGLLLLTPMYFLTSIWGSARERASHVAMGLGIVLGPLFHVWLPSFDLLAAGLTGGGLAYAIHLAGRRKRA